MFTCFKKSSSFIFIIVTSAGGRLISDFVFLHVLLSDISVLLPCMLESILSSVTALYFVIVLHSFPLFLLDAQLSCVFVQSVFLWSQQPGCVISELLQLLVLFSRQTSGYRKTYYHLYAVKCHCSSSSRAMYWST